MQGLAHGEEWCPKQIMWPFIFLRLNSESKAFAQAQTFDTLGVYDYDSFAQGAGIHQQHNKCNQSVCQQQQPDVAPNLPAQDPKVQPVERRQRKRPKETDHHHAAQT